MYTGRAAHPKRHGSAVGLKERADLGNLSVERSGQKSPIKTETESE